jgi:hypothetical protein
VLATLVFLTPLGGLVALVALLPLAALELARRRSGAAARTLGLAPAGRRSLAAPAILATTACGLLGLAAAQPALRTTETQTVRTRSQVFFVVDVSRSMAAAGSPGAETRLERARSVVERLRAAVPDVPSGLAGLTDRVLPYLLPTTSGPAFAATLRSSVALESPPPQSVATNATTFGALSSLATAQFFGPEATRRTCVVVSDGESRPFSAGSVASALDGGRGCHLVMVRVGGAGERVFDPDGQPEPGYRADPAAAATSERLAEAVGGSVFDSRDVGAAARALRDAAEAGPRARLSARATTRSLAPWAAGLALAAMFVLAVIRLRPPDARGLRSGRATPYDGVLQRALRLEPR